MTSRARYMALSFAAVLAASCAADDTDYYNRALQKDGEPAGAVADADGRDPLFPYELSDLSPAHRPHPSSDEAGIWYQMDKAERRIRTSGRRYRNADINRYVASVACRVTGQYCKDIRVYVVHAPGLNASMAANGMMSIQTGLLLRVQNEAELAAIIGHEAGHYLRQHSLKRFRDIIAKSNSLVFFNFVLAASGIPGVGDLATLVALGDIQAYGRNHEREADGYGLLLMSQAGYDPEEYWKVWDRTIKEMEAVEGYEDRSLFFASHPQPEERMEVLRQLAKQVKTEKSKDVGAGRLHRVMAPIRADLIRDELNVRRFGAFEVLLDQLIEDGENLAELYYFKGEMRRLRAEDGDLEEALKFYSKAREAPGHAPADLERSAGLVQHKLGRVQEARKSFAAYLRANPRAADVEIIRHLMQAKAR